MGEAHHLVTEQGGAEDHILRPVNLERRYRAHALRQSPAAKVLHGPDAERLRTRSQPRDDLSRLNDQALDASSPELDGRTEPDRATPDNEDVCR